MIEACSAAKDGFVHTRLVQARKVECVPAGCVTAMHDVKPTCFAR